MSNTSPQGHRLKRLHGLPGPRFKFLAGVPERIFALGPIPLIAPRLEIGLGAVRQKHAPCCLEVGAGLIEGGSGAVRAFSWMATGIKAAMSCPAIFIMGRAGTHRDDADADVTKIDVPTFVGRFQIAAAGEGEHVTMIAQI